MSSLLKFSIKQKHREYRKKRKEKIFKGNIVHCTICHSEYREFGAFGHIKRKNAQCHNCGSLERHRLVWKYIQDKELINRPLKLLHFAPEKVFYDIFSESSQIDYFPCDLHPNIYDYKGKTSVSKADITQIPFEDDYFDFILCNHVLEHIPDDALAMSELFRVMKPNGMGIFQVPIDYDRGKTYEDFSITSEKGRLKAFGRRDHVRWYGQDYKERLANAGFEVTEDDYISSFTKEEQFKYGFDSTEKVYLCHKRPSEK
ncbi:methyltransferase domain-containing protein [Muricauda oceani]|uniref:Methyltransferase domain-containing protein n=1 Tax=Flagellimonas oceani TaxID=2698672 RepID=A0A6G7J5T9_9FLAO|nr:class I SAM-dependent methyltransferase [Allomuricauda oceani]MBW8242184.1 methyltransferase domain-containing protein [Allomuricauda oceani]QII45948.1 methyltransferase domain-containing protein [Allomuricauda oceani]